MWLLILIGLNIIAKVHGYASGYFPESCGTMEPQHRGRSGPDYSAQNGEPPFESCYEPGNNRDPFTVFLRGMNKTTFEGFMLGALDKDGHHVGKFIVLDPIMTRVFICGSSADSAASNFNNQKKSSIQVNWTAQTATDVDITFRVTFLETYKKFWKPVNVSSCLTTTLTPSTQPSTATSTARSTPTSTTLGTTTRTTTSPAATTTTTKPPIDPLKICFQRARMLALIVAIVVVFLKMALSNIFIIALHNSPFSRRLNKVSQISCSLLCAVVEIPALVLLCVAEPIKVTLVALVCVAIVFNIIGLVIVCLPIGPSHELKEICDHAVKVCSAIHQIFPIAVIFVGVSDNCRKTYLLKVMVTFTVFILLGAIWLIVISTQRKAILGKLGSSQNRERWRQHNKEKKLSRAEVIIIAVSVIFTVGNLCFAVAVAVGIFGCQLE